MIRRRLMIWTYENIKFVVDENQNESIWHDFKANVPYVIGLTKDCCAFANTNGGFDSTRCCTTSSYHRDYLLAMINQYTRRNRRMRPH